MDSPSYTVRAYRLNKRAKPGTGRLSAEDIAWILNTWGEDCFYCLTPLTFGADGNGSFDHLISQQHGGLNTRLNCVPCCTRCNNEKGSKWIYLNKGRTRLVFRHRKPALENKRRW